MRMHVPANCRVQTVAGVMGRLLGCAVERVAIRREAACPERTVADPWYAQVLGVVVEPSLSLPECAHIHIISSKTGRWRRFLYHFELGVGGSRGCILGDTAEDLAVAMGVVRFFGGRVLYETAAGVRREYRVKGKKNAENHAEDGAPFHRLQERLAALSPLSDADRNAAEAEMGLRSDP